ncbi:MAG: hypothetical protein SPK50_03775 [Mobiluncus porci]|uniref:Uncharacterized protein n=1 Tax=Mobiluncus porci TaxID=2652278 RepID=A0A7K0K1K3_9ACTO|nr:MULTISPECIES: hypothetical protein [Mobiluncus]MCI6584329.1 hypothetical protein [Mobiluncus sp.]MDD7540671.1 hypothetical protein [Mobiluncus porci]MDY5748234.1 hypothetical protein [Mobiluncus porci]MST49299.1 hypothetical protein [Mobiluncus porci]
MSDTPDPLSAIPSNSLLGASFTPDEPDKATAAPNPSGEETVPIPAEIPQIVRATWEIDSQTPPLEKRQDGRLFTIHKLSEVVEMVKEHVEPAELEQMRQVATENPTALAALPFALPDEDADFLSQLGRLVWTDDIQGVAVLYETDAMLTAEEMQNAPEDPAEREKYVKDLTAKREKSRFVVAATRTEAWSVVHPHFESNPEQMEQGPALVMDLLQLITRGRGASPEEN